MLAAARWFFGCISERVCRAVRAAASETTATVRRMAEMWAALTGALVTVAATVVWSIVERRRVATAALVADAVTAFTILNEKLLLAKRASLLDRVFDRDPWLPAMVAAESARTRLIAHLARRRWRSKRLGLRDTLVTQQARLWSAASVWAEQRSAHTLAAFEDEVRWSLAAVLRWSAWRRSYWRGDIANRIPELPSLPPSGGPAWWRKVRPGRLVPAEEWLSG